MIDRLLNPGYWLALLAVVLALWGGYQWVVHTARAEGRAEVQARWDKAAADARDKARETEQNWQADSLVAEQLHDEEIKRITAARDAALGELRTRQPRRADLPEAAASACQGATGAELSGPDAAFLAREAARADELRAALQRCEAWAEAVTQ